MRCKDDYLAEEYEEATETGEAVVFCVCVFLVPFLRS